MDTEKRRRLNRPIDVHQLCVTRDGRAASFHSAEAHPIYPIAFKVERCVRTYTIFGEHFAGKRTQLDLLQSSKERCPECHGNGTGRAGECVNCDGEGFVYE